MKLFGAAAAFGICLADIGFDGAQENYVAQVGEDLLVSFDVTFPPGDNSDLTVVVRADADGTEKEHKFYKLAPGKNAIKYELEPDVEDVYVDMDDQISASIEEDGDGRVTFNANLTSVLEAFDGTEFTVEADYGAYSDSTSFLLSAYKLPVLETTLNIDSVNENMKMNETVRLIDCAINEAGYKPKEMDFGSVMENVIIKIGGVELMTQLDTNSTNYYADFTSDDIKLASPISSLNGASATCEFSYSFLEQTFSTDDVSTNQLEFIYDPTFVSLNADGPVIEKFDKRWGAADDEVTVTCEADGNPKPELIITVDGQTVASGAGQDETSKLSTQYRISNTGEQTVACEIDGTNSKGVVAKPLSFDYHYLADPVLSDNRVNATRNVFRAGEDSKNSVFCSADGRPNDINIEYTAGGTTFNRDGLFTEAANLTITCTATNRLSGEIKKTDMRIQVLPPLVPDEPESGGASIVVIIIVVLLVILLLGAIAFFIIKKRRESESESSAEGYAEGQPKSEAAGDDV